MNRRDGDQSAIRERIERLHELPVVPSVVRKVQELCENQTLSMGDIGDFLARDPSLSAKVLKAVNSPLYGFPGRISSLRHALVLLGLNFLKGLIIGLSVADGLEQTIPGLWKHSAGGAVLARHLAKHLRLNEPDEVATGFLLHDVGKMVLATCFPAQYKACLAKSAEAKVPLIQAEYEALHVDHAQAFGWLAQKWSFPPVLVEQVFFHHEPELAPDFPLQTAVVHASDVLIRRQSFGFSGDPSKLEMNVATLRILKMSDRAMDALLKEAQGQLDEVADFLKES